MRFFLRRLLILTVFALFPILVVQIAFHQIERLEAEKLAQELAKKQLRLLGKLRQNDSNPKMILRAFNRAFNLTKTYPFSRQKKIVQNLYRIFPEAFDAYFFDKKGKLIPELSSKRHAKRAVEMAFKGLKDSREGKTVPPEIDGLLKNIFTIGVSTHLKNGWRTGTFISNRDRNAWTIYDYFVDSGQDEIHGYFALIHPVAIPKDLALRLSIRAFNRISPRHQAGWANTQGGNLSLFPENNGNEKRFQSGLARALGQYDMEFRHDEKLVVMVMRKGPGYIYSLSPFPTFFPDSLNTFFHSCCLIWLFLVLWKIVDGGQGLAVRIPTKLLALFLFAVGVPSLLLLVGGFYALKDRSNIRQRQLEEMVQEKVQRFDERFPFFLDNQAFRLRETLVLARREKDRQKRIDLYKRFEDEIGMDFVIVVNNQGKEVFKTRRFTELMQTDSSFQSRGQFSVLISRELLKRLNGSMKMDAGSLMMEATTGVLNTLVGDANFSFESLLQNMGLMFEMSIAGESSFLFIDSVQVAVGEDVEEIATGFASGLQMEALYLQKNLRHFNRQPGLNWRVHAFGDYTGQRMREKRNYKQLVVTRNGDEEMVFNIGDTFVRSRNLVRQIVRRNGSEELWMGLRGKNLSKYTIVVVVSLDELHQTNQTLWFTLVLTAVFVLVSTLVIGMFLSEQFLQPIEDLNLGIRSIEVRDFKYQVPVHQRDELGEMALLMNTVLDGMKDLQVARIVQENLFPQSILTLGHYQVFGKSRAMTDIGGDYFDYFPVGKTQIVGLVGDVSGHGVSAALIMGMAKCNFAMDEHQSRSLLENLVSFNSFLLKTIQKKKMMTMFHFGLNVEDHQMTFINAGHNFPIFYEARTGKTHLLEQPNIPLGIMKKVLYKPLNVFLEPGDAVLLYTDGLVEAKNTSNEVVGYEATQDWFREYAVHSPEDVVERLFARLDRVTAGSQVDDDVSIICLKRMP